jgi:undecaprenyl-diphosphatase
MVLRKGNNSNRFLILTSIGFGGFISVYLAVVSGVTSIVDDRISHFVTGLWDTFLDNVFLSITVAGNHILLLFFVVLGCDYLFLKKKYYEAFSLVTSFGLSSLIVLLTKYLVARERPDLGLITLNTSSFPSGHSALSAAVLLVIFFIVMSDRDFRGIRRWAGWVIFTLAIAIPVSRVYLNVHYFTDVLGGFLLGLGCASVAFSAFSSGRAPKFFGSGKN